MTDREERQHVIEILQKEKKTALHDNKWAFDYAINSIETDLKYDLLYEQESNCSEIPTGSTAKDYLGVDAISRQAINGYIDYILSHGMGKKKSFDFIKKFVTNLPPATPQEPKTGHWMGDSYGYICSNCEHSLNDLAQSMDYISFSKPEYCPNCGAKMIDPQESED